MTKKLNCGCERGYFLCPDAVELWERVDIRYRVACGNPAPENWHLYDEALEQYDNHFLDDSEM